MYEVITTQGRNYILEKEDFEIVLQNIERLAISGMPTGGTLPEEEIKARVERKVARRKKAAVAPEPESRPIPIADSDAPDGAVEIKEEV